MKGNSSCHCPNNKYRESYDRIFNKRKEVINPDLPQAGGMQGKSESGKKR
jgi:hypothetical protein